MTLRLRLEWHWLLPGGACGLSSADTVRGFPADRIVALVFFSNYLQRAYHGFLLPLIGFLFLPLTTLAYAWMVNTGMPTVGANLLILIVAIIIDLGGLGGGAYHRRR